MYVCMHAWMNLKGSEEETEPLKLALQMVLEGYFLRSLISCEITKYS